MLDGKIQLQVLPKGGSFGRENIEVHVLTIGVFAEDLIGLALRIHVEGIAEVFLLESARVIHVSVPVWIGAVIAGCNGISILGKVNIYARFLHALL